MAGTPFELKGKTVFVAGHKGLVGGALVRRLARENVELLTITRSDLDLRDQAAVFSWFADKRPQAVFLAAGKVGGIVANNTLRGEFIYDNLVIATNVIHAAHVNHAEKLMFLGSSCIYPKLAPQPMREDSMLTGPQLAITSQKPGAGWALQRASLADQFLHYSSGNIREPEIAARMPERQLGVVKAQLI